MKSGRDRLVFAILLCFVQDDLLVCTNPSEGNAVQGYKYAFANAYAWKFRYPANYFTEGPDGSIIFSSFPLDPSASHAQQAVQPISQQLIPSQGLQQHQVPSQQSYSEPGQDSQQTLRGSRISIPATQHHQQLVTSQQSTRPSSQAYTPTVHELQQHWTTSQQSSLEKGQISQPTFATGQMYTPTQQQLQQQLAQRYASLHQQLQQIKSAENANSNATPLINKYGEQIGWQYYPVAGQHTKLIQPIPTSIIQRHSGTKSQEQGNIQNQMCPYGQHCSVGFTQPTASGSESTYPTEQQQQDYNQLLNMQQNLLQILWTNLQESQRMNAFGGGQLSGNPNGPVAIASPTMSNRQNGQPQFNTFTYTNA